MSMGSKLAEARRKNNLTQEQLAEQLGVSRQAVSRWESDTAYPETDKIVRMAELFHVSCDWLLRDGAEAPAPGRRAVPGSVSGGPGAAGLLLAGEAVRDLLASAGPA